MKWNADTKLLTKVIASGIVLLFIMWYMGSML